jgi:hypothetical protein
MKNAALFFLLLVVLGGSGCFNVREPEKPAAQSEWISPTQPDILLSNFSLAVGQLNSTNYERCFVPASFKFTADPEIAGGTTIFQQWSFDEEREYFNSLKTRTPAGTVNSLQFMEGRESYFTPDSLEYTALYKLTLTHTDTVKLPSRIFKGTLRFLLRRQHNEWKISHWQDQRESGFACWSDVKQHFISP